MTTIHDIVGTSLFAGCVITYNYVWWCFQLLWTVLTAAHGHVQGQSAAKPEPETPAHMLYACESDPAQPCSVNELDTLGHDGASVRPSGIVNAGLGAFARHAFRRGDAVGSYKCIARPKLTAEAYDPYSWEINASHVCDANAVRRQNPMRYVNSVAALRTCELQNAANYGRPPAQNCDLQGTQ